MDLSAEHVPKSFRECIRRAWLEKERGESVALRTVAHGSLNVAAHRDDGNVSSPGVTLHILKQLPAVVMRQRQISYNNVRVHLPCAAKRLGPF